MDNDYELEDVVKPYLVHMARVACGKLPGAKEVVEQQVFALRARISEPWLSAILNGNRPIGDCWTGIARALGQTNEEVFRNAHTWKATQPRETYEERVSASANRLARLGVAPTTEVLGELVKILRRSKGQMSEKEIDRQLKLLCRHEGVYAVQGEAVRHATRRRRDRRSHSMVAVPPRDKKS